ncbi:MAG: sigma 54-interacting transcriptional regulator [Nitrospira sp.]|nr:sigma 54-interacting transcriptional regulator [Nitrospira sp.]
MKRDLSKDDDKLITRLRAILDGRDAPETRIGQALAMLEQESETKETPGRSSEAFGSSLRFEQADDSPTSVGDDLRVVPAARKKKQAPVIIGNSTAMQAVYAAIQRVSNTSATVLLRGESGTGKELVAQRIHLSSARAGQPFVAVHCAAVPETLIETTLFGHERGAFTGANQARKGRLEQAAGGTLFLDEVGDIPLSTQVKLLRVLQDKEFERVGSGQTLSVDVRLIAATHRHLEGMVRSGEFREDLYYRLNVVPLTLPPLRARRDDVRPLMTHFLDKFNRANSRDIQLGKDLVDMMSVYHWPGNIRELQNCIERLVVLAETSLIELQSIPETLAPYFEHVRTVQSRSTPQSSGPASHQTLPARLDALERDRLRDALRKAGWVKAKAARLLGMTPRQIAYRIEKYRLLEEA